VSELPCLSVNRAGEVILEILVAPRASSNRVIGIHAERLKLAVTAPPVDGRANERIVEFLAELLGVPKRAVVITVGETGRRKQVTVTGVALDTVRDRVSAALAAR